MSRNSLLAFVTVILMLVSAGSMDSEELWRVTSPDSRVDAVFMRFGGGGATVGFSYKLFIVPHGEKPAAGSEVLSVDKIRNVSAVWSKPRKLEISYDQMRIFSFANFWQKKEIDNFSYVVELQLVPTGTSQLGDLSK